jgi:signal transduction histidine kinase
MEKSFLFVILSLLPMLAKSQSAIHIDGSHKALDVGKYVQYYEDKSRRLVFNEIRQITFQRFVQQFPNEILNLGATSSALWLRINIEKKTEERYYLQIDNTNLDSVLFYFPDAEGNYQVKMTGKKFPIETESVPSTHCIIALPEINIDQPQTYYLRLTSGRYMNVEMKLIRADSLPDALMQRYVLEFLYFGMIILAIVYNLFIYLSLRDIAYLYYVIYTFIIAFNIFNTRGYLSLLFPDYRDIITQYTYLSSILYIPFITLFTLHFLHVKQHSLILYRILKVLLWIAVFQVVLTLFKQGNVIFQSAIVFVIFNMIFYVITGAYFLMKKQPYAIYYFSSWGIFTLLTLFGVSFYAGLLPFYSFVKYLYPTAIVLETVISSMAIFNRIQILRKNNEEIQKKNMELIKEQNQVLEARVKERTAELEGKNKEIETQNYELAIQKEEIQAFNEFLEEKVSERTQELQLALENIVKQNQDLAQFSYIVSHNLRAPVARIIGLVNIFNYEDTNCDFNKQILQKLRDTSVDFTVIKDLTQIVAIRNSLDKTREYVDLEESLAIAKNMLKSEIQKSNAQITSDFYIVNSLFTVSSYVQDIFYHLLSNAIKYRKNGQELKIHCRTELINNYICLSVADDGIGIDLQNIDKYKIFGLYQRMHDHVEGKGMGLFLVKTQIESLNGMVDVQSQEGVGSVFKVYFPK